MKNIELFISSAQALLADYLSIYCVDTGTGEYCRFSPDSDTGTEGADFFGDIQNAPGVYEEDRVNFDGFMREDNLRGIMKNGSTKPFEFRVIIDGKPVWHTIKAASSADMLVLGYFGYISGKNDGQLDVRESGDDFFADALKRAETIVHPKDKERVMNALDRDTMITQLYRRKKFSVNYRLVIDGSVQYMRFTVMWSGDKKHILIGTENIDSEIKKEKDHLKALNSEKELARRDDLTGTKNKTAYLELIRTVQENIDNGIDYLTFAIVVCDINGLKQINDTEGHQAGDEYIRECANLICSVFAHSPVFRIGGDEFVVFIRGGDYAFKGDLFEKLRQQVLVNRETPGKPVVASGMSSYDPSADKSVGEVFDRADNMMYENKKWLKGGEEPR